MECVCIIARNPCDSSFLILALSHSPHTLSAKKYNELFPKEKKDKSKKPAGSEGKAEGKGKKQQKPSAEATPKKKEAEPEEEEDDDLPKPVKFVDPLADLPKRCVTCDLIIVWA